MYSLPITPSCSFWMPSHTLRAGPILRAHLHHAAVLACRFDHLAAFPDAPGGRLLDVHMLARLAGHDRLQCVPVILRAETDGVDGLVGKQLGLAGVFLEFQVGQLGVVLASRVQLVLIAIADGRDLHIVRLGHGGQAADVRVHPASQADKSDTNPLVGTALSEQERGEAERGRCAGRHCGRFHKSTPIGLAHDSSPVRLRCSCRQRVRCCLEPSGLATCHPTSVLFSPRVARGRLGA